MFICISPFSDPVSLDHRYPPLYPRHPVVLRALSVDGIDTDLIRALLSTLNDLAVQHAKKSEVRAHAFHSLAVQHTKEAEVISICCMRSWEVNKVMVGAISH